MDFQLNYIRHLSVGPLLEPWKNDSMGIQLLSTSLVGMLPFLFSEGPLCDNSSATNTAAYTMSEH